MAAKITLADLLERKKRGQKIAAVSCYDYTTAVILAQTDVEMLLVGDSAAQAILGFDSTLPATMDFMVALTAAVRRGAPNVCLVADMPFLSYQTGIYDAVKNAARFFIEAGAQIVKVEVTETYIDVIKAVSDAGMAVMAHIGIRPQSISRTGRLKAEATTAEMALKLVELAEKVTAAGASSLLLEGTAAEVASIITQKSPVPVISCGSGPDCDGQILIAPDILGLTRHKPPKFAKSYADLADTALNAFKAYCREVRAGSFPDAAHSYHMLPGQIDILRQIKQ